MGSKEILALAIAFETLAKKRKGRTEKSVKKQYKTMTKGKKHPFKEMEKKFKKHPDKIDDPAALAAWMKDIGTGTTKWRGEGRKKKPKKD